MQNADTVLAIYKDRGAKKLPIEGVYKHLLDPELFLRAYGKIYRNYGAMTKGTTEETVDGMSLQKIHRIIDLLKQERYQWTPVRRTKIPKPKGGTRPLGIPTWSNKLVQEAMRILLEPYYEQRFSDRSHGFRPKRSCHSALRSIQKWTGTVWFVEGDITGCYDNIDQTILLEIIRRDIQDGRLLKLIDDLLKAGYMEEWRYFDSLSGTPQGGIISPLLANIYLNELDRFVEETLIPAYTRGGKRKASPKYTAISEKMEKAWDRQDHEEYRRLTQERRKLRSYDPCGPDFRRLRYVRYADDFLLGLIGPREEAVEIRNRLNEFLASELKLTLSPEKTLITHSHDEKAKFLGHEITVTKAGDLIASNGQRATNGKIALLMPRTVVAKYKERYSKEGRIIHKAELLAETDYTITSRYQSVLQGVYNFYCMATNVSRRMSRIKRILEKSLTQTLANKHQCRVNRIYEKYETEILGLKALQVTMHRPGKDPLVATFGGIPFKRNSQGMGVVDFVFRSAWFTFTTARSEVVQRLLANKCELCEVENVPLEVHHIRKLADIDRPGRQPKERWEKLMSARKRKTLVVCESCHGAITHGRYDGPSL
jgi:group II intron reverse transcriptase/maturase